MATEVEINTIIDNSGTATGLKDLRKALKELVSLQGEVGVGSDQFKKLQKAINDTEGKLGDLNDSFHTLRGSGVERLNNSIGLLREGFLNADPGKLTIAMEGLSGAMKAIPIFLIIEGVKLLFDNWSKLTAIFSDSAKELNANKKALEELTIQVAGNKVQTDALIIVKEQELSLLVRQNASLDQIISKIKEIDALKQDNFRGDLSKTDKEIQNIIAEINDLKNNIQFTDFLPDIFGGDASEKRIAELTKRLAELSVKRGEVANQAAQAEIQTENHILDEIEKARHKAEEARQKRIATFQEFLKTKNQQEIEIEQDRINAENKIHEEEINKIRQQVEEQKALRLYLAQQTADEEKKIEEDNENKRRLRSENRIAFENSFHQKNLEEKIDAIQKERDTILLNEQLTQAQRIKIIEDAEQKIFNIKVQKGQQTVQYAQQIAGITNSLNQLITQDENQHLREQQYAKDAAIQNDLNRTQNELDREELRKNQLLSNAKLTATERDRIAYDSETRQQAIARNSKNAQDKINEDFARSELAIKKDQFERNKKLQIATGVVNTAAAVLQTLASVPYPASIPLAFLAGFAGAAQVAIIASQEFDDGGSSARTTITPSESIDTRSGFSSGSPRDTSALSPRTFDPTGTQIRQSANSTNPINRVVVLESDISETSARVEVLEGRRTFAQ